MKQRQFTLALMSFVFLAGCANPTSTQQLQGTWTLVYQEIDGQKVPDENAAKFFHGEMSFTGEEIHYKVELQGFDFWFTYVVYPDQQPKGIDLTLTGTPDGQGVGRTMFGIYRMDAGTLKICYSATTRPSDFSASEGSHRTLILLKR